VVGDEDDFLNNILGQIKLGPVVPLWDDGKVRLQPTYVPDVAAAVVAMLQRAETAGQELYLGGPEVLSMRQVRG
jgi:nucleoside-diphosphate-sugar epimerase